MDKNLLITIGRQFGSGGKQIATCLSQMLDIPVYDNELLMEAARSSGLSEELFRRSDEKKRLFSFASAGQSAISEEKLFRIQSEVILSKASQGGAVFVGRAADYVLREQRPISIFISAPLQERIRRVSSRAGLSSAEALDLIRSKDKSRAAFYDFFTDRGWGRADSYDLCVDSSLLGIEQTAVFIRDFCLKAR